VLRSELLCVWTPALMLFLAGLAFVRFRTSRSGS
jgi:hypothetical protein